MTVNTACLLYPTSTALELSFFLQLFIRLGFTLSNHSKEKKRPQRLDNGLDCNTLHATPTSNTNSAEKKAGIKVISFGMWNTHCILEGQKLFQVRSAREVCQCKMIFSKQITLYCKAYLIPMTSQRHTSSGAVH